MERQFILSKLKYLLQHGKRHWWLSFVLWLAIVLPAQAAVEMRVALKKNVAQLQLGSSTPAVVRDASGRQVGQISPMNGFSAINHSGNIVLQNWRSAKLSIEPSDNGYVWIGDRWYRGKVRLIGSSAGMTAINDVDLEEYLYSVVGSEAIPSWPLEALKAQAVAARSYALYQRSISTSRPYDLEPTTTSQVYKGLDSEYISTQQAVNETAGEVMTYNSKIILAVFHSSSGGHTENVEDVWTKKLAYLRGVVDYDQNSPVYQWTKAFSKSDLGRRIGGVGNVISMVPEKTTPLGRVVTMKVVGDRGTAKVAGTKLRELLDLRSTLFTVDANSGTFQIYGKGFGHGIGLSQWGAYNLAVSGTNYRQILDHYYQNASLSQTVALQQ